MIPTADLEAARALVANAIDGPWSVVHQGDGLIIIDVNGMWVADVGEDPGSAGLIAAAPTLVPALLDEVTALRAALREALEIANDLNGNMGDEEAEAETAARLAALVELAR